jgi:TatD DNase family protein
MPEHLDEVLDHGWYVSFAGNATYPKNTELADAIAKIPAERLLVETDAPYLTPQPVRKHPNQPAYVVHTAQFVAERRGVSLPELDRDLERTAATVFGW